MPDDSTPYLIRGSATSQGGPHERVIAAFRIPYLPDSLSSRGLNEQAEREAQRGILGAQTSIIAALTRWQGQAFALRYLFRPEHGSVEIALLLRADAPLDRAPEVIARMGGDVTRLLASASIPTMPVTSDGEALALLNPPGHSYIAEIRQHEELIPLRMGDAYIVSPLQPTTSTWLATFDRLVRQPAPCLINIHLQPTRLLAEEREAFEQSASLARGLKDFSYSGTGGHVDLADPLAGTVAALYDDYARRLTASLLMTVQVSSPSVDVIRAVTDVFMRDISERRDIHAAHAIGQQPCGCDMVVPQTTEDAVAAHQTLSQLDLRLWGSTPATSTQHRLRFLVDPPTAGAAFRFPLPTRTGIPGVEVRASGWGRTKVFLSYRRDDSAGMTGRIYDRLAKRFGKDAIYMDVATIPLGTDFAAHIRTAISDCAVQLVIIGPHWLELRDAAGARRLDDPDDYVRMEVEVGLNSGIAVIPILVDGAAMPPNDALPRSLNGLTLRNAKPVRHADFEHDMETVIVAIEEEMRRAGGAHA